MINFNNKNILILSPHTDDMEVGMGGTIYYINKYFNINLKILVFSCSNNSLKGPYKNNITKEELKKSLKTLNISNKNVKVLNFITREFNKSRQDILEILYKYKDKTDIVFCPNSNDLHQDHQVIYKESIRAFRKDCCIFGYELLSNTLISNLTCFFELDEETINKKIESIKCYNSQLYKRNDIPEIMKNLAIIRGAEIKVKYAELFEIIRWRENLKDK